MADDGEKRFVARALAYQHARREFHYSRKRALRWADKNAWGFEGVEANKETAFLAEIYRRTRAVQGEGQG